MWDLPWHVGPGLEPVSPALAGGLLTTAPPGKSGMDINKGVSLTLVAGKTETEGGCQFPINERVPFLLLQFLRGV